MRSFARERAHRRIRELTTTSLDLVTYWRECTEALTPAVPHYLAPCWFTLDPASLLVTSHFQEGIPEIPQEWLAQEYYEDDFNKMADVARSARGAATLHDATGGDPSRSIRHRRDIVPYGGDQELIVGLRTEAGEIWGCLGLYREPGRPMFDDDDIDFLTAMTPTLAEGARRSLLLGEATHPEGPDAPGLLVFDPTWEVESMTPGVERWLDEFPDGDRERGALPSAVRAVAGQAMRRDNNDAAFARVLGRSGTWLVLHGASLGTGADRRAAVIVEHAHPSRIAPLLMAAYRLTDREQEVTRHVLRGSSTTEIARSMFISAHTVQQHLKHIFDKTGVRTRRDLVGKIFFAHYEPRVRDNEERAANGRPARGGPLPA